MGIAAHGLMRVMTQHANSAIIFSPVPNTRATPPVNAASTPPNSGYLANSTIEEE